MTLIKLDSVASTNDYLKEMCKSQTCDDFTVVVAQTQTQGRGQRDSVWESEPDKNLTFSVLKNIEGMPLKDQFKLSMAVCLGVIEGLSFCQYSGLKIKWPNDIMSGDKKLGGVLIENVITGQILKNCVIGIGINVNQIDFSRLPHATSLALGSGKIISKDQLLEQLRLSLEHRLTSIENQPFDPIKSDYLKALYRFGALSEFQTPEGHFFNAVISGVDQAGQLELTHDNKSSLYDLKSVKMIY